MLVEQMLMDDETVSKHLLLLLMLLSLLMKIPLLMHYFMASVGLKKDIETKQGVSVTA